MDDEIDIYGDLDHLDNDQLEISPEVVKKLRQENADSQKKVEELSNELERVNKYSKTLEANISSLHKTAQVEIARKDGMITELRQQLDNAAFRRNTNFRIPRRTPRPLVISLPPKDESTCTEMKKEEVNDTIKKGETTYSSPLIPNEDDDDDTEHIYQPDKIPVTVFGERLRRKLEKESREEAEKAQQPPDLDSPSQHLFNIEKVKSEEDKDNQYRLIPLTLQKLSENLRKRGSDNLERSDELKTSEKHDDHRTSASHDNKRRRMDDNKSRRDISSNRDGYKNSKGKSANRKRMEIEAEYCCSRDSVKDKIYVKNRYDSRSSSRHQQTQRHGSRSRSKSRERRDRKEGRKDSYSSLNRMKENRVLSKSPSCRHESEKIDKYRSSQRGNDRYEEKRRENSRDSKDSKRPIRKCASPPVRKMDLRRRLDRRNDATVERKILNGISSKNKMMRETKNNCDTSRSHRRENSQETLKNSHVSKSDINDRKHGNESIKMDVDKNKKSISPSIEMIKPNLCDEEIKVQGPKQCDEIFSTPDNQQDSSDDIEEGEILDSPSDTCENQTSSSTTDKIVAKVPEPQNFDDSMKEEKIENIEMFIEKMQERDKEGEENNFSEVTHNIVENDKNTMKEEINLGNWKTKTDITLATLEKDTSDESVHLSHGEVHDSDKKTTDINKVERMAQKTAAADNDSSLLNKLVDKNMTNEIESAKTVATLSIVPEKLVDVKENSSKGDSSEYKILEKPLNASSETGNEKNGIEEISETYPKLFEALQGPRPILHEISSSSKASVKSNEIHEKKSVPKQKENSIKTSSASAGRTIVVARRKKVRLSDTSTSWTVVMSEQNSVKK